MNLAKYFKTKIVVQSGKRWDRLEAIGISEYFVTDKTHDSQELDSSIYMKPLIPTKPMKAEECDKDMDAFHFVLTGWKDKYWVQHPNFFKIPYSSHSSTKELLEFVKLIKPVNLIFNCRTVDTTNDKVLNFMCQLISESKNGKDIQFSRLAQ